ncbi:hypothetical protein CKAH01_09380 [Colletotrichum kahawae]|uniref:NACHT-NTPase and P-loop NTPases N-terminal domain-containing protein n=1 Tax=Colletotrichum kahawae TaxID=34407 RepID=A0AAD9Y0A4_COLKA|nr:hypothetical protein CKAH01_09380 [Colletotrichum kahawae]
MSGAEVVIGLIAGVIGLLEAANKAYDTIKDIAGLPKAFEEVSQRIPLVEAEDLRDILVKLANGDSGWDQNKYVQMVKCKGKKTRVEDLMKKIVENIQFLASDQTMKLATSQQLQELRLAVDGLTHVEPSAPDEVSGRGDSVTIHHSGNGPQNNHIDNSNSFTTWNNHGNGHMVQGNIYYGTPPGQ